jgi:hypothetical protein
MTFDARRLVAKRRFHLPGLQTAMRLVAINATDCSFVELVSIGFGKRTLNLFVAIETEQVGLVRQQMQRFLGCVHTMAIRASNLIPPVQAIAPARVRFRTGMASKTSLVHFFDGDTLKNKDLSPIAGIDVSFTRSMTGFTALIPPTFGIADFQYLVGILTESVNEVLVAGPASGRRHVSVFGRGGRCLGLGRS